MVQVTQYPKNPDGSPLDLLMAVITDLTGNGGARLTAPILGPDGAPIDAVGMVFITPAGDAFVLFDGTPFGPSWNGSSFNASQDAIWDRFNQVDNTSDMNKPVSTATATALGLLIPLTQKGALNGVATLDAGGLIPSSQLPPIAITKVQVAANQAAQLALTTQEGDVVVRTDQNKSYIRNTGVTGTMTDFNELLTPTDAVLSVAGLTGAIGAAALKTALSLVPADIGLGISNVGNANLNTIVTPGFYRFETPTNGPTGVNFSQLLVIRGGGDTIAQVAIDYSTNILYWRSGNPSDVGGAGAWSAWRSSDDLATKAPSLTDSNIPGASITPVGTQDMTIARGLNAGLTINAPSGSPAHGFGHVIRLKDNGTSRSLSWNAIYRVMSGVTLPTATVINKTHYIGLIYNATDTKWDVISVAVEA